MSPGYQAVQGAHALQQFNMEHADTARAWFEQSNYLAFLSTKDEGSLMKLIEKAKSKGIEFSIFSEPDLDNQITAITLAPGIESKRLCSNLKLALKETSKTNEK